MIQNEHIELGYINILEVNRVTSPGIFLISKDTQEVLLPNRYCTNLMQIGDLIKVFIYTDSEDRLVATTFMPMAKLGEFGVFKVVDTVKIGAFLDWGLPKDLFIPRAFERESFKVGDKKLLCVILDEQTNRLVATQKYSKYISQDTKELHAHDEVDVLIYEKTPLGFKVIVQNKYFGMLFHNEIFEFVSIGGIKKAYIKKIRDDGKLDISLQKIGHAKKMDTADRVLEIIKQNNAGMAYNYKSDAKQIKDTFQMSKKAFKSALTVLQSKELIIVNETGIYKK